MMGKTRMVRFSWKKVHLPGLVMGLAVGLALGCSVYASDHCANRQGNSSCEGDGHYCSSCLADNNGCTDVFPAGDCYFPGGVGGTSGGGGWMEVSTAGATAGATMQDGDMTLGGEHGEDELTTDPVSDTETSDNHPVIVISDGEIYDFGAQDVSTMGDHVFTVSNEGNGFATSLDVGGLDGVFEVQESGCESILAPGSSCDVAVGFNPVLFGLYDDDLEVSFEDTHTSGLVSRPVRGRGVGVTSNLLINGDAEQGALDFSPPLGWVPLSGDDWVTVDGVSYDGMRSIFAGLYGDVEEFAVLYQAIEGDWITNEAHLDGVRFSYRAYHRGISWELDTDRTQVRLRFFGVDGAVLGVDESAWYGDDDWYESWGEEYAPRGTSQVRLELVCDYDVGEYCSGYFDSIELWAEWSG